MKTETNTLVQHSDNAMASSGSRGGEKRSGAHAPGANHRGDQISNFKLIVIKRRAYGR